MNEPRKEQTNEQMNADSICTLVGGDSQLVNINAGLYTHSSLDFFPIHLFVWDEGGGG